MYILIEEDVYYCYCYIFLPNALQYYIACNSLGVKSAKNEVQEMKVIFSVKQFRWREGEKPYRQSEMCVLEEKEGRKNECESCKL